MQSLRGCYHAVHVKRSLAFSPVYAPLVREACNEPPATLSSGSNSYVVQQWQRSTRRQRTIILAHEFLDRREALRPQLVLTDTSCQPPSSMTDLIVPQSASAAYHSTLKTHGQYEWQSPAGPLNFQPNFHDGNAQRVGAICRHRIHSEDFGTLL